ncbi:MAG: pyridoxal-dependent decarboxylase, exosortase A system-associated [Rhodocyclaceae bacterium]|nr:pyridoxal-dependent decarboxylase, exosortase A system-associated [Rhodocyclaceae bacterium]MCP5294309.1 pyridoxal-dependent decarboxylase, exosortase A system-associated [Zoogloeaceae bacterium]
MTTPIEKPRHAPIEGFPVIDGMLTIGGVPVERLSARVGATPFYAYDRRLLDERAASLRQAFPESVRIHYAMKANPFPALVAHMARLVDGIDVASAGELKLALDAGAHPREISFAGPGKRLPELRQAVASGILVNIESVAEIARMASVCNELGLPGRVALRVNPDFELKSSGMKMGGGPKPFGIDAEAIPEALSQVASAGLGFEGFHLFAGSQNLRADAIIEAQSKSFELAMRLAEAAPAPLRVLNLGGGFGIPYFPGERRLDLAPIAAKLHTLAAELSSSHPDAHIVIELGRYLVGEAGVYVTRVVDRKISRGQTFLVCDGGLNHHLSASGNFGQVIRKNYPVAIANRMAAEQPTEISTVVGPLCTPLDLIADRMALPTAQPGDLVAIFQSGAYGASASPSAFLGHPAAQEVLV